MKPQNSTYNMKPQKSTYNMKHWEEGGRKEVVHVHLPPHRSLVHDFLGILLLKNIPVGITGHKATLMEDEIVPY